MHLPDSRPHAGIVSDRLPLVIMLALAAWPFLGRAGEPIPLFNGQDLSGWHVNCRAADQDKSFWKVENGTILCDSMGRGDHDYVWLMTDQEFGDFELRLKFQAYKDSPGNSGLQFRSRFDPAAGNGWLDGPQVDIHPPEAMNWRTGFIYDETREEKRWVFPGLKDWNMDPGFKPTRHVFHYAADGNGWNDLVLTCQGMRVKTVLNGVVVTDWNATGVLDNAAHAKHSVGRKGHFALQLHSGDQLRIRFKDIVVRELPETNPFAISTGPVLQCPTENSVRITWLTDRPANGSVEFGPMDGELKTAQSSRHGLIDANERLHSVQLEGLEPGTLYQYRVVSREITDFGAYEVKFGDSTMSDLRQFRTLDSKKTAFSFVVLNDVHDQPRTIPDLLRIAGAEPYDFVVLNGDIVSHTDQESQVTPILDQATATFASRIPMFWIRGNHETRGRFARNLPAYMGLPDGHYYYAFSHGPVRFVVLDAGEDKRDSQREYSGLVAFSDYRRQQAQWLKEEVRGAAFRQATYRIVICHMPFASRLAADPDSHSEKGVFTGMADAFDQFGQTLESAGIDLMLSGHMHVATIIPPEPPRHSYPVVIGGGSQAQSRTVMRVNVSPERLNVTVLRPDGSVVTSCNAQPRTR